MKSRPLFLLLAALAAIALLAAGAPPDAFQFVILGDRTGDAQEGVYEQVWREAASEKPAFVVTVGDMIQGTKDGPADAEWRPIRRFLDTYRQIPLYLTPGNHDVWSEESARLFEKYAGHPPHYSFDYGPAHFTILDNSRSAEFPPAEIAFLESDLAAHAAQPLKFVVSHRPSWIVDVALGNRQLAFHQLAKKYGVRCVVAGHIHQLAHAELEGIDYLAAPSSGAHLRDPAKYEDGRFFGHILVTVRGGSPEFEVREAKPPHGQGRTTRLAEWGRAGLLR